MPSTTVTFHWVNILHFYQPPFQSPEVLERVATQCYEPVTALLKRFPRQRVTMNIAGSLLEQLAQRGHGKVIKNLQTLVRRGQVELMGSACYHPLLPLLPLDEAERQIALQERYLHDYFSNAYQRRGFFLPELAYSDRVGRLLKRLSYEWIVLDKVAIRGSVTSDKRYVTKDGLEVIFRNRHVSRDFPPSSIRKMLHDDTASTTIITATDGELYGYAHRDLRDFLYLLRHPRVIMETMQQYRQRAKRPEEIVDPRSSTWDTTPQDFRRHVPYPLWKDPHNKIHIALWELARKAIRQVAAAKDDSNYFWARWHLDRGLASCTFWWSSGRKPNPMGPLAWSPDEIGRGLNELIRAIRSLESVSVQQKIAAEKLYIRVQRLIWQQHWTTSVKKIT